MAGVPKYALLENERRFLVRRPPDLTGAPTRLIEDLYLAPGRLRLRRITPVDGGEVEHKLCKKYGSDDPASEPIVNIYLTTEEYAVFADLPGRRLSKRRSWIDHGGHRFSVDVFDGPLSGLVMCETEAATPQAIRTLAFPPWAGPEVTGDRFFSGAHLATVTAEALAVRLAEAALA